MNAADVLDLINDHGVKFVDLRFTDTIGKEQHVSIPASTLDEDVFTEGKMFDGSSIAGWKGINESDMIMMLDAGSAVLDPFTDEPTINIRCDIIEPTSGEGYERDPRSLAKRAEALKIKEQGRYNKKINRQLEKQLNITKKSEKPKKDEDSNDN